MRWVEEKAGSSWAELYRLGEGATAGEAVGEAAGEAVGVTAGETVAGVAREGEAAGVATGEDAGEVVMAVGDGGVRGTGWLGITGEEGEEATGEGESPAE